ncbi:hypothetical protein ACQPXB_08620 [Amycolatopsis sp. CA-161197]
MRTTLLHINGMKIQVDRIKVTPNGPTVARADLARGWPDRRHRILITEC